LDKTQIEAQLQIIVMQVKPSGSYTVSDCATIWNIIRDYYNLQGLVSDIFLSKECSFVCLE
jgi:hypothetical protein